MITETQSYSWVIRNVFFDAVAALPFFAKFTKRRTKFFQVQDAPFLGVYIIDDVMAPDGDPNAGHIKFTDTLRIGFSVFMVDNDADALEAKLDQAWWAIMNRLWPDQYIMNMLDTRAYPGGVGSPDNTRIEGVVRGQRRMVFGATGSTNEKPLGELQYEIACFYRADFPPVITDDLLEIDVVTKLKADSPTILSKHVFTADADQDLVVPTAALGLGSDPPTT